jgi:hypothetical protein
LNQNVIIRRTQIADAAKYLGSSPLSAPASVGDRVLEVDKVYSPLVPSAQSENPITDQAAGAQASIIRPASTTEYSFTADNVDTDANGNGLYYTGKPIVPGTLTINSNNGNYVDEGGLLRNTGGSTGIDVELSRVDYRNGQITAVFSGGSRLTPMTIEFIPGAVVNQQSKQAQLEVDQQTRSLTWVYQAAPLPAPATMTIEYRAQGSWYLLRDEGAGAFSGDGTGSIDYTTGTANFTFLALPDAGTSIIVAWGEKQGTVIEAGASVADTPTLRFEIGETFTE